MRNIYAGLVIYTRSLHTVLLPHVHLHRVDQLHMSTHVHVRRVDQLHMSTHVHTQDWPITHVFTHVHLSATISQFSKWWRLSYDVLTKFFATYLTKPSIGDESAKCQRHLTTCKTYNFYFCIEPSF